ncbi:MAG: universal stress protein [Burkholderiales bacterium]|nr:universal stress protein [Burkholderiales bacterium]
MKILLPIDGSPDALAAVRHALHLVRAGLQASFVLANVQTRANLYEVMVAHDPAVIAQLRSDAGADLLRPAQALLEAAGAAWESEVAGGEPATLLVDLIEKYGCDAVIMGSQGAGSLRSALLGSVSGALLRHSPVPVTVVRRVEDETDAGAGAGLAS